MWWLRQCVRRRRAAEAPATAPAVDFSGIARGDGSELIQWSLLERRLPERRLADGRVATGRTRSRRRSPGEQRPPRGGPDESR